MITDDVTEDDKTDPNNRKIYVSKRAHTVSKRQKPADKTIVNRM